MGWTLSGFESKSLEAVSSRFEVDFQAVMTLRRVVVSTVFLLLVKDSRSCGHESHACSTTCELDSFEAGTRCSNQLQAVREQESIRLLISRGSCFFPNDAEFLETTYNSWMLL